MTKAVFVTSRADAIPAPGNFEVRDVPPATCPAEGLLVEVIYAAVDPGMRGWLSRERNYLTVADGEVMRAHGVGRILESRSAEFDVGDIVYGWLGWQQVAAVQAKDILWKADLDAAPAEYWLSALGLNGLTAWVGLRHLGQVKRGETVLVSTCAGGVGSIVGQLAHNAGARVVGLTGDDEKIRLAVNEFGYDAAINYKTADDLEQAIAKACPEGIDLFFDNTAGHIADIAFPNLNIGGRIIQCGTAAIASWNPVPTGPRRERDMLTRRLSWRGFLVFDHMDVIPDALDEMKALIASGALIARHEVIEGLDQAPGAIAHLYSGRNTGRLIIRP